MSRRSPRSQPKEPPLKGAEDKLREGRVGEAVGLLGGEGLADVLVGHCSPRTVHL
jgi:hypothetical protein